jgi:hypothetical protein
LFFANNSTHAFPIPELAPVIKIVFIYNQIDNSILIFGVLFLNTFIKFSLNDISMSNYTLEESCSLYFQKMADILEKRLEKLSLQNNSNSNDLELFKKSSRRYILQVLNKIEKRVDYSVYSQESRQRKFNVILDVDYVKGFCFSEKWDVYELMLVSDSSMLISEELKSKRDCFF